MVLRAVLVALLVLVALASAALQPKRLAGPPEEFHLHSLRNPADTRLQERSITEYVWLAEEDGREGVYTADMNVPIDGDGEFVFSYASQFSDWITLAMDDPRGRSVDLAKAEIKDKFPVGAGLDIPLTGYVIHNSRKGTYRLTLTTRVLTKDEIERLKNHKYPHAVLTFINDDNLMIESHLTSYVIAKGKKLGVSARVVDNKQALFGGPIAVSVASASLNLMTPSGQDILVPMNDEGMDGDVLAKDGVYGAEVDIDADGQYIAQPVLTGYFNAIGAEEETEFVRSTQHLVTASPVQLDITGKATIARKDAERTLIHLAVSTTGEPDNLRAYTEVYGTKDGKLAPVAWLGGRVDVKDGYVTLELNARWLLRAGAGGSLVLRNTYIADLITSFPIASYPDDIAVDNSAAIPVPGFARLLTLKQAVPITKEMREGVSPFNATKRAAGKSGVVMVPGYCATINPWKRNGGDFTGAYFFDEPELNVSNDEYAKKVIDFAENQAGLDSFGLIGHSQGGVVSLHIHNYYFSALEAGTGPRLIQSVGTPFQGSTAAGSAADLGRALGYGCGANSDLSRDGAVNWLAGISSEARKDVYYFTTTYKQGGFFGDYCSLATNTILQWPNDGVTELKYAKLDGANDMGNEEKWCHTTDLKYPAQYDDHVRNADMNKNAAR